MTPTPTIGTSSASILFAGPRETYEANRELFAALAEPSWLGEEYGRAAGYDMALLDLFWTSMSGFLHALTVAGANGIASSDLLPHARGIVDILPRSSTNWPNASKPTGTIRATRRCRRSPHRCGI